MPRINNLVVAVNPEEKTDFLAEPILSEMRALPGAFHWLDTAKLSQAEYYRELAAIDPDVLVACWSTPLLPATAPARLRYFCNIAGGVRTLIGRPHLERGMIVTNWGSSISRTVAECALLLTLACLRRAGRWIPAMYTAGAWRDHHIDTASLFEKRVGLHGFGQVARALVKLLAPFDTEIGICAPEEDLALYAAHGARRIPTLEELFAWSDVIIDVAPFNSATAKIVSERLLRLMRPGAVFVNVGRGGVVDEEALVRVAREGLIHVGLDVFATEPLPADSGLRGLPNVVLLPHLAGPTLDRRRDAGAQTLRNLRAYSADRPLDAVITPEIYDSLT